MIHQADLVEPGQNRGDNKGRACGKDQCAAGPSHFGLAQETVCQQGAGQTHQATEHTDLADHRVSQMRQQQLYDPKQGHLVDDDRQDENHEGQEHGVLGFAIGKEIEEHDSGQDSDIKTEQGRRPAALVVEALGMVPVERIALHISRVETDQNRTLVGDGKDRINEAFAVVRRRSPAGLQDLGFAWLNRERCLQSAIHFGYSGG